VGVAALLVAVVLLGGRAQAQPLRPEAVPEPLEPWVPWVLDGLGDALCPVVNKKAVCVWPGELSLELFSSGGDFRQRLFTDRALLVELPGSSRHWPQEVQVDGRSVVVLEAKGNPAVRLEKGEHEIRGRFRWSALPEALAVPASVARVRLSVDGERVSHPKRSEGGSLWLRAAAGAPDEPERLELEVFRRIDDGVPLMVTTRIDLRVSGRSREVDLGRVLLEGSTALSLSSGLPVRLEPSGELLTQVRAGTHSIELRARVATPPEALLLARRDAPWPEAEVWVWSPNTQLRQVELQGGAGIDPARTNLPADWKKLRAFLVRPPGRVGFRTLQRGEPEPPPNDLRLRREIWLDLGGGGYTVRDRFGGELRRTWRLDLAAGELGHVTSHDDDQLITVDAASGRTGVELRRGKVDLTAEWRIDKRSSRLPAVGWSEDVQELATTLHVPPGWQLVAASGVDELSETWLGSWNLFEVFLVLLIALAVARLFRPSWGVLGLLALVLSHDVDEAPSYVWLVLLALVALLRVLPPGWIRNFARAAWWVTAAAVVVLVVSFGVLQVRSALFPASVEPDGYPAYEATVASVAHEADAVDDKKYRLRRSKRAKGDEGSMGSGGSGAKGGSKFGDLSRSDGWEQPAQRQLRQDPNAVIQTGPGVPTWRWKSWRLRWSGPVKRDHAFRLVLLSPWETAAASLLRVVLMGLFGFLLLRHSPRGAEPPQAKPRKKAASARRGSAAKAAAAAVGLAVLCGNGSAAAQVPPQSMLDELKTRLTRKAPCQPDCVAVPDLSLTVRNGALEVEAEVHVGAAASYKLPGPASGWVPGSVKVDGKPSYAVALLPDGFLHLRLGPGRHRVELAGPIDGGELTLTAGTAPRHVRVDAPGWTVDGVGEDGQLRGSIHLSRQPAAAPAGAPPEPKAQSLPPWLEIERTLDIGVTWTIQTKVRRISPKGTPVVARFALLPGEEVTEADRLVEQGELLLSLDRDETELRWTSSLKPRDELELRAPRKKPWTEVWILRCGAVWRCATAGMAPFQHQSGETWQPSYRPWPGEALTLSLERPGPAEGRSVTIDAARLELWPGTRLLKAKLELTVRSSSGGVQVLGLPEGAEVQSLTVQGQSRPIRQEGSQVSVSLQPGSELVAVEWQQPGGLGLRTKAPRVSVGGEAVNGRVVMHLPHDRWLLWAWGPRWGPAVLFWGYLLLLLAAAAVLGRLRDAPLRTWQWALLALGLTQLPVIVPVAIASWFFLLGYRRRWTIASAVTRNLAQVGVILWTLVFLGCLVGAVVSGLLGSPDMEVAGQDSSRTMLSWYVDRLSESLPQPWVLSTPLWLWRVVMLAWALWLAWSLVRWLRWAWSSFTLDGAWRPVYVPKQPVAPAVAAVATAPSGGAPSPGGAPPPGGPPPPGGAAPAGSAPPPAKPQRPEDP